MSETVAEPPRTEPLIRPDVGGDDEARRARVERTIDFAIAQFDKHGVIGTDYLS